MFSLFKKNKGFSGVPEWASFFEEKEYKRFTEALDQYFRKKSITYTLGDGVLHVDSNAFGFETLGLTNVTQVCKQQGMEHYSEIVADHFDSMLRAFEFEKEFNKIVEDYNQVKQYIGVRLYSNDYVNNLGKEFTVGKDFAGDVYAMLVFDLPDSITNIKPEQAAKWGRSTDELFETGLKNIKEKCPVHVSEEEFGNFKIWFVQGEHFFAPNIVYDLDNHKELLGSKGALIGIPHRHVAIIYPIETTEVIPAINGLIPVIYGMNEEGPGSLSNNLFWYRDGHFENLPYKISENKLQFIPPKNFVAMLEELANPEI